MKPNFPPIPTSEKLEGLLLEKEALKARSVQTRQNVVRLTKIIRPDFLAVTVRRTDTDIWLDARKQPGVIVTGGEPDDAQRKAAAIAKTRAGESIVPMADIKDEIEREHKQCALIEDAIEAVEREIWNEKQVLAIDYSKQCQPLHDALLAKVLEPTVALYTAWSELHRLKQHLIDGEIGLHGVFLTPEFLGHPADKHSPLSDFIHEAAKHGFVKVPVELRF